VRLEGKIGGSEKGDEALRRIEDVLSDAEVQNDAMGADEYLRQSYSSGKPTPDFTRLKEAKYLGYFAEQYNERNTPGLVWARRNEAGSDHADFSVYDDKKSYLCDLEITALFSTPTTKDPKGYEDFSPYPRMPIAMELSAVPGVTLWDIDRPKPGFRPYARLERTIEMHLREAYPPYWLVIYDNEHGVCHPNLKQLEQLIRRTLEKNVGRGRLPANLKQVWAFDLRNWNGPTICRAW
jgi:hypothetical protein